MRPLHRVLAELKRRRVVRAGVVYAAAGWVVFQVAESVFPRFGFPDWTITFVLVLALLGFPLALALAWAFEVTPDGVRRTRAETETGRAPAAPATGGGRLPRPWAAVLLLLVLGLGAYAVLRPDVRVPDPAAIRSIAVLPFANTSEDASNEYFSDGVTDELMSALAGVDGLRVAARTSSFQYKGRSADVREVARALDVQAVLDGSVRKSGDRVRITAQLVEAESGYQLWAESYEREVADVFAVQDDIARAIVAALRLRIAGDGAAGGPRTGDPEAHTLYLKGRFAAAQRSTEAIRQAVQYYEQAIARDPGYAAAYSGLGDAYLLQTTYDTVSSPAAFARARAALTRALALDSTLAEAHTTLAALLDDEHDWTGADAAFRRAIALNPSYATAHHWYALHLATVGRMDAALEAIARAERLDPLSPVIQAAACVLQRYAGDADRAIAHVREAIALAPGSSSFRAHLALALAQAGRFDEALELAREAAARGDPSPFGRDTHARVHAAAGHADSARALVAELERDRAGAPLPFSVGATHAALGDLDAAFRAFDRNEWSSTAVLALVADPLLGDALRRDPRYARLLASLNLGPGGP